MTEKELGLVTGALNATYRGWLACTGRDVLALSRGLNAAAAIAMKAARENKEVKIG